MSKIEYMNILFHIFINFLSLMNLSLSQFCVILLYNKNHSINLSANQYITHLFEYQFHVYVSNQRQNGILDTNIQQTIKIFQIINDEDSLIQPMLLWFLIIQFSLNFLKLKKMNLLYLPFFLYLNLNYQTLMNLILETIIINFINFRNLQNLEIC